MSALPGSKLTVTEGTVLSFTYNMVNLDSGFRFGVRQNITVQLSKLDCGNTPKEGEIGLQASELDELIATKDYFDLTINGHKFDSKFQLTGFTMDEGNWSSLTEGTISVQSFEEGDVAVDTGNEDYKGWDAGRPEWKYLEEFSDDFTFSRAANSISYTHNVNFKFGGGGDDLLKANQPHITDALTIGLEFAQKMVNNKDGRPSFDWLKEVGFQELYSEIAPPDYKRLITETVDEINNTVNVTETFEAENVKLGESCGSYSFSAQQTIDILEDGIINVSEKGTLIGLELGDKNRRKMPEECLDSELEAAVNAGDGRLQKVFEHYTEGLVEEECVGKIPDLVTNSGGELILTQKGITRDPFRGKISYSVTATNDQELGELAKHEFTVEITALKWDTTNSCLPYFKVTRQGTFTGVDAKNIILNKKGEISRPRFDKAKEAWDDEKDEIKKDTRDCAGVASNQYPVAVSNTYSPYKGTVSYSIIYSTEPKYGTTSTDYKLWTDRYNYSNPAAGENCLFQYTLQNVVNHPDGTQLLQKRNTTQLPSSTDTQKLVGKRDALLKNLLTSVIGKATPTAVEPKILKDCNYTFNAHNDIIVDATFNWE
jgi:hypothetical protein